MQDAEEQPERPQPAQARCAPHALNPRGGASGHSLRGFSLVYDPAARTLVRPWILLDGRVNVTLLHALRRALAYRVLSAPGIMEKVAPFLNSTHALAHTHTHTHHHHPPPPTCARYERTLLHTLAHTRTHARTHRRERTHIPPPPTRACVHHTALLPVCYNMLQRVATQHGMQRIASVSFGYSPLRHSGRSI